jgi:hypothetical protein
MWYLDFYALSGVYSFRELFPNDAQLAERRLKPRILIESLLKNCSLRILSLWHF